MDEFEEVHVVAIEHIDGLMRRAELGGLLPGDYRAPMGRRLRRKNKPWVGELKSPGPDENAKGHHREYRLYFGEAPTDERSLVAAYCGFKHTGTSERVQETTQDGHIKRAMNSIESWCKSSHYQYRQLRR